MEPDRSDSFDLAAELETLSLLEAQADDLRVRIASQKRVIAQHVKPYSDQLCLRHLIKECDGILCAAKVITQRICDKIGIHSQPVLDYANLHSQHTFAFDEKKGLHSEHLQAANIPLMLTKNVSTPAFRPIDLVNPPNPLLRVLQVLVGILGLSLLFRFVRRKCMSVRNRVERAADLEERRNERAYRRAARRALVRKRWDGFLNAVSCFRVKEEPRREDYEEKRALILQDALLEQELDQAEKGEVMEAEIRELRYAHEIVSSLVRADAHNRYDLITPINDPPPPLVPLPYTPATRSRASTYTLPSYTSESLPDYSSTPDETASYNSVTNGITSSTSDEETRYAPTSPPSETSSRTRYTPTSSIRETSPRPSDETLRTRQSKDTR